MDPSLSRLRVAYRKCDRLAFLGHLEVLHTIERSVRRSGLPFAVSSGFARRMRLQFSQALPVGAASDGEYYDIGLQSFIDPGEALQMLRRSTPAQLSPYACAYVPPSLPALEAWLTRATWKVVLGLDGAQIVDLDQAMRSVVDCATIHFMRGNKARSIDLTNTLVNWEFQEGSGDVVLTLNTRSSNRGALRPAILLDAIFATPELSAAQRHSTVVTRTAQYHEEFDGNLIDAFEVTISPICTI